MTTGQTNDVEILVNGQKQAIRAGSNLVDVLRQLQISADRVAIEMDRKIVRKLEWADTTVGPGTELEIVQFVGGG